MMREVAFSCFFFKRTSVQRFFVFKFDATLKKGRSAVSFVITSTVCQFKLGLEDTRDLKIRVYAQNYAFLSKTKTHQDPKPGKQEQSTTRQNLEPGFRQMKQWLFNARWKITQQHSPLQMSVPRTPTNA
jgi:hypothetical protein